MERIYTTEEINRLATDVAKELGGTVCNWVLGTGHSMGSFKYVLLEGRVLWAASGSQSPGRRTKLWTVDIDARKGN